MPQYVQPHHWQQQQQQGPKRAWMLLPQQYASLAHQSEQHSAHFMDEWQYSQQTAGWNESWEHLQHILQTQGPFDGVLGFSQGAAVAAVLCAQQVEALLRGEKGKLE